jgi:DNA (cytosine-5)-methyltransferase 1
MHMTIRKPEYRVPLMAELADVEPNGYRVISTFTGAGGSCLGFRMAGFTPVWASEFVPAARETYIANGDSSTIVDDRDIRDVGVDQLLAELGLEVGEIDVLEGSPPCAPFSTAGKRSKHWGEVRKYSDVYQRVDDLFDEYIRLLDGLRPKVFIAENVAGMVRGVAVGYFQNIYKRMEACGYRVQAAVLDAQWLGVPQSRKRVIFMGVREDLGLDPVFPTPRTYRYSVRDAIPWITGVQRHFHNREVWTAAADAPAPTVLAEGATISPTGTHSSGALIETQPEPARAVRTRFPDTSGRAVGLHAGRGRIRSIDEPSSTVLAEGNPGTRSELTFAVEPEATIKGAIATEYDHITPGRYSPKYKQLIRAHPDKASPTISASHGMNNSIARELRASCIRRSGGGSASPSFGASARSPTTSFSRVRMRSSGSG